MHFTASIAAVLAISLPLATAQTFTDCNPTEKTCPQDTALNNGAFNSDFTQGEKSLASWTAADGTTINFGDQGAEFSISKDGQAPTISTDFYIFFGRVDVKMQASPGAGIISSVVFESDDLDEIDWEFTGGDTSHVQSNFFGKGNTTSFDRVEYLSVSSPQTTTHTYSVDWNSDRIEWIVDGNTVRTLTSNDPLTNGGSNYPQTPMRIKVGSWCGGCKGEAQGTVQWAGGPTTFEGAPYVMYVESVAIQNYNPADAYEYTDKSGSWQSIKLIKDGSSSSPSGSVNASVSAVPTNATSAPTKSIPVSQITGTGVVATNGGNYSMTATGSGGHGTVKTSTSLTTVPGGNPTAAGATGSSSALSTASMQNSAATYHIGTSASLLGMLFSLFWL